MAEPIVELSNVNIYQSGTLILGNVNIVVNKAEFVYLVGKTGHRQIQPAENDVWRSNIT